MPSRPSRTRSATSAAALSCKWVSLRGDLENSAGAVIEALEPLQYAAGEGLAVLVVSHQRKSFGEYREAVRGSSALVGGVDIVIELERPAADTLANEGTRVPEAVSRFAATPDELVITLTDQGYEAQGDTLEARAHATEKRIVGALDGGSALTADELAEASEIKPSTLRRHLPRLEEEGILRREGAGKRGDPARWRLIPTTQTPTGWKETGASE